MEWTLKICGKMTRFEVLDDVIAFRPQGIFQDALGLLPKLLAERVSNDTLRQMLGQLSLSHRQIFDAAGWNFIHPPGFSLAKKLIGAVTQRHVYATEHGALMIGTRLATVKFFADMTEADINAAFKEDHLEKVFELKFAKNLFEVKLQEGPPYPELINKLQDKTDRYIFAEPSLLETITGRAAPAVALEQKLELDNQWQHLKPGLGGFGINSLEAWKVTRGKSKNGDRPVRIAVIDNGMQISHREIKPAIIGGGCFPADDGNPATPDFRPLNEVPDHTHGTLCMGMAGARINDQNDLAPAGSAPEADLIAIAINPTTTQTTLSRAIEFAVNPTKEHVADPADGADIISCSLGTTGIDKSVLQDAVAFAKSGRSGSGTPLGTPIFWAVNNDPNQPIPSTDICSNEAVIAVGSSDRAGLPAGSSPGKNLAFLAPGKRVLGIRSGDGVNIADGSSVATPLAAGVAALVLSINANLSDDALRDLLRRSCEPPPGLPASQLPDETHGSGIINSANAVQKALEELGHANG
jgi:subtilisin family serine protease